MLFLDSVALDVNVCKFKIFEFSGFNVSKYFFKKM